MKALDLKDPRDRAAAVRAEARNSVRTYVDSHYMWDWPRNVVQHIRSPRDYEGTVNTLERFQELMG